LCFEDKSLVYDELECLELSSHSLSAWVAVCGIQSLVGFGNPVRPLTKDLSFPIFVITIQHTLFTYYLIRKKVRCNFMMLDTEVSIAIHEYIRKGRLKGLLLVHVQPIKRVVCPWSLGALRHGKQYLGRSLALRCFASSELAVDSAAGHG
jgi:hypothetical protein